MAIGVGVLVGALVGGIAKLLTAETIKFIAFRALIYTGLTLVLPVVLYNVFTMIISELLAYVDSVVGGSGLEAALVELTGVGAYLAIHLKVPESIAVLLGACSTAFVIRMIKR